MALQSKWYGEWFFGIIIGFPCVVDDTPQPPVKLQPLVQCILFCGEEARYIRPLFHPHNEEAQNLRGLLT